MIEIETPRQVATTATVNATLAAGKHTPVDATSGNRTMTLPAPSNPGAHLSVEKVDSTTNTVTISGSIRGATGTYVLTAAHESVTLVADASGSWWSTSAGQPGTSVAAQYAAQSSALNFTGYGTPQHEDLTIYAYPNRLTFGTLTPPPLAKTRPNKGIDIIAHWYNDFGLEYEASSSTQANGTWAWYDWSWNYSNNPTVAQPTWTYDPARHPLLGNYKGDDPVALDWICYWLAESGVNVLSITDPNGFDNSTWTTSSDARYWQYQLFTNSANFKLLKFMLWTATQSAWTLTQYEAQSTTLANFIGTSDNPYVYQEDGKAYPVVFNWDIGIVRGALDNYNGATNTTTWLTDLATKMQGKGYDGVCVLARNFDPAVFTPTVLASLKGAGVLLLAAEYSSRYGTDASYSNLYSNYASSAAYPTDVFAVPTVVTAAKTQLPHPSGWTLAGSTPTLFGQALRRAVKSVVKNKQRRMLTVYNVSEWAEGGPGLIPNKQDGFGYLDQIKSLAPASPSTASAALLALGSTLPFSAYTNGFTRGSANGFSAVVLDTLAQPSGLAPIHSGGTYLIPTSGFYSISALVRVADGTAAGINVGVGVGTTAADGPTFAWYGTTGATRTTLVYTNLAYFNAGDQALLYVYVDTTTLNFTSARLSMSLT